MDINTVIIILLIIAALALLAWWLYRYIDGKRAGLDITEEEFSQDIRRKQVIDLREADEFEKGHILGARNIPLSQLKMRVAELRRDRPVYLYCQKNNMAQQASAILKKEGYDPIYRLKGGYEEWTGRIKTGK